MQAGVGAQAGRQAAPRECEQPVAINDKAAKDRSHFMAFSPSLPAGFGGEGQAGHETLPRSNVDARKHVDFSPHESNLLPLG
jgi:hypothetical protein